MECHRAQWVKGSEASVFATLCHIQSSHNITR